MKQKHSIQMSTHLHNKMECNCKNHLKYDFTNPYFPSSSHADVKFYTDKLCHILVSWHCSAKRASGSCIYAFMLLLQPKGHQALCIHAFMLLDYKWPKLCRSITRFIYSGCPPWACVLRNELLMNNFQQTSSVFQSTLTLLWTTPSSQSEVPLQITNIDHPHPWTHLVSLYWDKDQFCWKAYPLVMII